MAQTALAKVQLANAYTGQPVTASAAYMNVTTTVPGSTAPTEPSGGSPANARVASGWGAPNASTGVTSGAPAPVNVPPSTPVQGVGYFTAQVGGNYYDGTPVTSQSFASQGTYTVTPTLTPQ